jgi:hypothetical protein
MDGLFLLQLIDRTASVWYRYALKGLPDNPANVFFPFTFPPVRYD